MESSQSESESCEDWSLLWSEWEAGGRGVNEKTYLSAGRGTEKVAVVVQLFAGMFDEEVTAAAAAADELLNFDFLRTLFFGTADEFSGSFVDSSSRIIVTDGCESRSKGTNWFSLSAFMASPSPSTSIRLQTDAPFA